MKKSKILALICAIVLLLSAFNVTAYANSAAPNWEGTDGSGVIVKEGDIPIVVENELLTFDLPTLPYAKYYNKDTFYAYDSKVTAKYAFYNPTDMTVTATLLFPFGDYPQYGWKDIDRELARYGVYLNGEKIEAKLRHTSNSRYDEFILEEHLASLSDEFIDDDFYTQDLTVTKYSYEIVGPSTEDAYFNVNINEGGSERRIVSNYKGNCSGRITDEGSFLIANHGTDKDEKVTIYFYVFGEPLTTLPDASWYKFNARDSDTAIDGEFSYLGSETTTLKDFIFGEYDQNGGVTEVDWYNACITTMKNREEKRGDAYGILSLNLGWLMRWYEYEITFQPGERIENTVVAPMYPEIDAFGKPYRYNYTYFLSPASCWADFGQLDIVINTPYEMSEVNIQGFEKTEEGYRLTREGLPKNEKDYFDLSFTLLNDGNTPKDEPNPPTSVREFFDRIAIFIVDVFILIIKFIRSLF